MQYISRPFLVVCIAIIVICAWWRPMDETASAQVNTGLARAVATYGAARILHGAVSIAQGTQISADGVVVGATFAPGQMLAPAAEMLKEFSDVMLMVCVAFSVEKFLIHLAALPLLAFVLSLAALGWLAYIYRQGHAPVWVSKIFIVLLVIEFAIPLAFWASEGLFKTVLQGHYDRSQGAISVLSDGTGLEATIANQAKNDGSVWARIKGWFAHKGASLATLRASVESALSHMVDLMGIFILQTIVLPLLLLWAFVASLRSTLRLIDQATSAKRLQPSLTHLEAVT